MRIGIDARPLTVKNFTGIPNYVYQICKQWMVNHPEHEYYLMARRPICFKWEELPENWHIVDEPFFIDNTKLWSLIKLPLLVKKYKLDVFWGPNYVLPARVKGVKYYNTIHDLAIYRFEGIGHKRNTKIIKTFLPKSCKQAERIITVSYATANDIHEILGIDKSKIEVCYLGKPEIANKNINKENIRESIIGISDYFLFVGTIEPRKNLTTVVKAFNNYCKENGFANLVIAGGVGWNAISIIDEIESSPFRERISCLGYITEDEKDYLLKNAKAFLFPSLYEGFGLPILEAYSYRLPVITSRNSALPEIAGDAALYIEQSNDDKSLKNKMFDICDKSIRTELQEKMVYQLQKFGWDSCADQVLKVITNN